MNLSKSKLAVVSCLMVASACAGTPDHSLTLHYLGHAAFLLQFDNGLTVLTDYGESRAYGLDSPVYELGSVVPDIATLSHDHADHAGGVLPAGIDSVLTGLQSYEREGLVITPIRTFERSLDSADNTSYLFEYEGLKVLHLGDCQALMLSLSEPGISERIQTLYPDTYDLVLVPIGYVRDILAEAAEFVTLLDAHRVIPMHYWSPPDRETFSRLMEAKTDTRGRPYRITPRQGALLELAASGQDIDTVEVVGLTPAAYQSSDRTGSN